MNSHTLERKEVCVLATGQKVELVVHTITGEEDGPTLVLFGGIHGDEAMGVEAVRRIIDAVEQVPLKGKVVAVPVCNPQSFETMTRHTVQDGLNLNRIFPGDAGGSVTEQLAAALTQIVQTANYFIDYHSSGLYSTVDYAYVHEPSRAMAAAFGTQLLYHHDSYTGSSTEIALQRGIPAMVSELGGGGQLTMDYLRKAVDGTLRVLRAIGMSDGGDDAGDTRPEQTVLTRIATLRPRHGGTIISQFTPEQLGTSIPKGTVLGKVINPHTFEVLEELVAPYDPTVLVLTREEFTRNNPGDYGFMVGDGSTTTTLDAAFGAAH